MSKVPLQFQRAGARAGGSPLVAPRSHVTPTGQAHAAGAEALAGRCPRRPRRRRHNASPALAPPIATKTRKRPDSNSKPAAATGSAALLHRTATKPQGQGLYMEGGGWQHCCHPRAAATPVEASPKKNPTIHLGYRFTDSCSRDPRNYRPITHHTATKRL
eukprot:scaffold133023_cov32-Tisochrysis_lutea.AAC.1